jgi:hypothetical protein
LIPDGRVAMKASYWFPVPSYVEFVGMGPKTVSAVPPRRWPRPPLWTGNSL